MGPIAEFDKVFEACGFGIKYPEDDFYTKRKLAGKRHRGIDFAPKPEFVSSPIFICAPIDGTVVFAGFHTQFGNMVVIKSADGEYLHMMCHLRKISSTVLYNKPIHKGLVIGIMGASGTAKCIHLHYQVEQVGEQPWQSHPWIQGNWKFIDPRPWLEGDKK